MEYTQQLYMLPLKGIRAKSVPSRKPQSSKRHFKLYIVLKEYYKTISISKNQQSLYIQGKD